MFSRFGRGHTWSSEYTLTRLLGILLAATGILLVAFFAVYYANHYLYFGRRTPLDQGVRALRQHILAEPADPAARLQLAALYFEGGEYRRSVEQAEIVLAENPADQAALYLAGLAYVQLDDLAQGAALLARFVDLRQTSSMWRTDLQLEEVLYYLGAAYFRQGELASARPVLEQALEIDRTDADTHFVLGQVAAGLGNEEAAAGYYLTALSYVPDFEAVYLALSRLDSATAHPGRLAYALAGLDYCHRDYDAALDRLAQAVSVQPDFAPAHVLLGLVYESQGESEQARRALETALGLDPANFLARHVLERLAASSPDQGK